MQKWHLMVALFQAVPWPKAKKSRKTLDLLFAGVALIAALVVLSILIGLIVVLIGKGAPALSWRFFTEQIRQVGAQGGIFYNLIGTLILITTAFGICAPIAVAAALWERVYIQSNRVRRTILSVLYTLNGLPSILFGIFGFIIFVKLLGFGKSWLVGGILLAAMMLPTVAVSLIDRMKRIPEKYILAASGLGLNRAQLIWSVLLPQSWGGLMTGSLLGVARAAGETAPIMFTATIFAGATLPKGIRESPVLSLPYHIFILAQDSFDPGTASKLWGSALVLLALVLLFSLLALPGRLKAHEEANV